MSADQLVRRLTLSRAGGWRWAVGGVAAGLVLAGCQDGVSIGFENRCDVDVEVSEEWISVHSNEDYVRVAAGDIEHVLLAEDDWGEVSFRVRRVGDDQTGLLWAVRQGVDDAAGEDRFDVVLSFGPEVCEQLQGIGSS